MSSLFETLSYYIIGALGFIVAFGLAVFIHELGHFLAAKFFKVPVERFVIGFDKEAMGFMPNCIWEKKIGETTYGLSLVPLGGYVKMIGTIHPELEKYFDEGSSAKDEEKPENSDEVSQVSESDEKKKETLVEQAMGDQTALYQKPFYQKFIIYAGGVFMNLVLAGVVIAYLSWSGLYQSVPSPSVVGWMPAESPFLQAGLEQGDTIVGLDGEAVTTDDEMFIAYSTFLTEEIGDKDPQEITEVNFELSYVDATDATTQTVTIAMNPTKDREYISYLLAADAYIDYVIPNKPAHRAKLEKGDIITAIDGEPIEDRPEAAFIFRTNADTEMVVEVDRDGERFETILKTTSSADEKGVGQIGVMFGNKDKVLIQKPLGEAIITAPGLVINKVVYYVKNLGMLVGKLVSGNIKSVRDNLGGPVAITQLAGYHANLGLTDFLAFLIALNIALAVMNILPLPILDGGHIVFAAYEGIFGKPLPPKLLVPLLNGALIFLLGFVLLVTFSDVLKFFGK